MDIEEKLKKEFYDELENIGKMEVGSEEHKLAVDSATRLADRIIEIDRNKKENRDRKIKNVITAGGTVLTVVAYGLAFVVSLNAEYDGKIFSTEGGRSALRELLKLKLKN